MLTTQKVRPATRTTQSGLASLVVIVLAMSPSSTLTARHARLSHQVANIVTNAITNLGLPNDPTGIYIVYGDRNTTITGMCTSFCAWYV